MDGTRSALDPVSAARSQQIGETRPFEDPRPAPLSALASLLPLEWFRVYAPPRRRAVLGLAAWAGDSAYGLDPCVEMIPSAAA